MRSFVAVLASFLIAGCAAKDDATLVVSARNPTLSKLPGPFDAKLAGSVVVNFDLGHWSGSNVTVESIQIGLYRNGAQIIPGAKIEPEAGTVFPLVMAPSDNKNITYTIVKEQLLKDEVTTLCAGPVTITGIVKQSGKPDLTILADPISASGCP